MAKLDDRNWADRCPNQMRGTECDVCGGKFICLEPWRKARTIKGRRQGFLDHEKQKERD